MNPKHGPTSTKSESAEVSPAGKTGEGEKRASRVGELSEHATKSTLGGGHQI